MAEVAILIPLMRTYRIYEIADNVAANTNRHHTYYIATFGAWGNKASTIIDSEPVMTWPKRINLGISKTREPYIFTGADDINFTSGWFEAAKAWMPQTKFGVVGVNDLHNPNGTHFLVSRKYIDEFGPLCHEEYHHLYVDDEIRELAKSRGRYAYAADAIVEHVHPAAGKAEWDSVYELGNKHKAEDKALFESRRHLWLA